MEELRKLLNILVLLYKNIWKSLNTREYVPMQQQCTLHSTVLMYCANLLHLAGTQMSVCLFQEHMP